MPKGKPTKPIPCAYCGELFLGTSVRQKHCGLEHRFLSKVNKDGPVPPHRPELGPCWEWTGARYYRKKGYGGILVDGRKRRAHRIAYGLFVGIIRDGLHVLHKCDNPNCVRPDHLYTGDNQDNVNDKMDRGRHVVPFGERHWCSKLTETYVREIRRLYGSSKRITQRKLARVFGVDRSQIGHVLNREHWKHVQ